MQIQVKRSANSTNSHSQLWGNYRGSRISKAAQEPPSLPFQRGKGEEQIIITFFKLSPLTNLRHGSNLWVLCSMRYRPGDSNPWRRQRIPWSWVYVPSFSSWSVPSSRSHSLSSSTSSAFHSKFFLSSASLFFLFNLKMREYPCCIIELSEFITGLLSFGFN